MYCYSCSNVAKKYCYRNCTVEFLKNYKYSYWPFKNFAKGSFIFVVEKCIECYVDVLFLILFDIRNWKTFSPKARPRSRKNVFELSCEEIHIMFFLPKLKIGFYQGIFEPECASFLLKQKTSKYWIGLNLGFSLMTSRN